MKGVFTRVIDKEGQHLGFLVDVYVYEGFKDGKRLKDNPESIQGLPTENTLFKNRNERIHLILFSFL